MSLRSSLLAAGFLALVPLAALAQTASDAADGPMRRHHAGFHQSELGFLRGVTLTAAQQTQLHQLTRTERANTAAARQQLRAIRQEIGDKLASTDAVTATQLTALQQKADQLRQQLETQRLATALQVRALLTPAQLAQSAQVHQQLAQLRAQARSVLSDGNATDDTPQ